MEVDTFKRKRIVDIGSNVGSNRITYKKVELKPLPFLKWVETTDFNKFLMWTVLMRKIMKSLSQLLFNLLQTSYNQKTT